MNPCKISGAFSILTKAIKSCNPDSMRAYSAGASLGLKNAIYVARGDNNSAAAHLHNIKSPINLPGPDERVAPPEGGLNTVYTAYRCVRDAYALRAGHFMAS